MSSGGFRRRERVTCGANLRGRGGTPARNGACAPLSRSPTSAGVRSTPAHRLRGVSPPPKTPVPAICNVNRRTRNRDKVSSISAAMSSPISPMKRKVKWKLPGSTHFAPGTPERSNDSPSLSSGGKPIPTKRRNMPSAHEPTSHSTSGEESENASVAIEPVARDFAVGEKADQREFAQALADELGLYPGIAKQRSPARDAADIDPRFRGSVEPTGELSYHADHVAARALRVAAAE